MIRQRRFYRVTFLLAGLYNITWGLYSSMDPQWLFRFAEMTPSNHPEIFSCLAMVVGLYGVLYLEIARCPERGWLLAAVGLTGKLLGPIGALLLIREGTWPTRALWLCVTNDFIWWLPFGLYLRESWPFYKQEMKVVPKKQA